MLSALRLSCRQSTNAPLAGVLASRCSSAATRRVLTSSCWYAVKVAGEAVFAPQRDAVGSLRGSFYSPACVRNRAWLAFSFGGGVASTAACAENEDESPRDAPEARPRLGLAADAAAELPIDPGVIIAAAAAAAMRADEASDAPPAAAAAPPAADAAPPLPAAPPANEAAVAQLAGAAAELRDGAAVDAAEDDGHDDPGPVLAEALAGGHAAAMAVGAAIAAVTDFARKNEANIGTAAAMLRAAYPTADLAQLQKWPIRLAIRAGFPPADRLAAEGPAPNRALNPVATPEEEKRAAVHKKEITYYVRLFEYTYDVTKWSFNRRRPAPADDFEAADAAAAAHDAAVAAAATYAAAEPAEAAAAIAAMAVALDEALALLPVAETDPYLATLPGTTQVLYKMKCEHGCYYQGASTLAEIDARLLAHRRQAGAEWTRLHRPLPGVAAVVVVADLCGGSAGQHENYECAKLMATHGYPFVRGGSASNAVFSAARLEVILEDVDHNNGACYACHQVGHFRDRCPLGGGAAPAPAAAEPANPRREEVLAAATPEGVAAAAAAAAADAEAAVLAARAPHSAAVRARAAAWQSCVAETGPPPPEGYGGGEEAWRACIARFVVGPPPEAWLSPEQRAAREVQRAAAESEVNRARAQVPCRRLADEAAAAEREAAAAAAERAAAEREAAAADGAAFSDGEEGCGGAWPGGCCASVRDLRSDFLQECSGGGGERGRRRGRQRRRRGRQRRRRGRQRRRRFLGRRGGVRHLVGGPLHDRYEAFSLIVFRYAELERVSHELVARDAAERERASLLAAAGAAAGEAAGGAGGAGGAAGASEAAPEAAGDPPPLAQVGCTSAPCSAHFRRFSQIVRPRRRVRARLMRRAHPRRRRSHRRRQRRPPPRPRCRPLPRRRAPARARRRPLPRRRAAPFPLARARRRPKQRGIRRPWRRWVARARRVVLTSVASAKSYDQRVGYARASCDVRTPAVGARVAAGAARRRARGAARYRGGGRRRERGGGGG
jgi:hypothetical protein